MSVVYYSLLLFVRIEHNVKIYNTLHLVFFTGYTYIYNNVSWIKWKTEKYHTVGTVLNQVAKS
jgi:hypothetical protein